MMLALMSLPLASCKKKTAADWAALSEKDLDEEWKDGDEEAELRTENDEYQQMIERRKILSGGGMTLDAIKGMKPEEVQSKFAHTQAQAGMAMIFATLSQTQLTGEAWTKEAEDDAAGRFTALLQTGGLKVSVYRIDDRRLLVTMQTGWYGEEVKDFLLSQKEVMKVTWDSIDYKNPDVEQDPDEEPAKPAAPKTTKKKKHKKKKKSGDAAAPAEDL